MLHMGEEGDRESAWDRVEASEPVEVGVSFSV
jgi:hypothetical protein